MGSTRLPGKTLAEAAGRPLLEIMLRRLERAASVDTVWVATTRLPQDDVVVDVADRLGCNVFRGPEEDVLSRYVGAARAAAADTVVRLTSDCPLLDPAVVDRVVGELDGHELSTNAPPRGRTFPDGMDVEAFTHAALDRADREAQGVDREHVTSVMHRGGFDVHVVHLDRPLGDVRLTVDTAEDLALVRRLLDRLPEGFTLDDVLAEVDS